METGVQPAAFALAGYKIKKFSLTDYEGDAQELLLHFGPSGELEPTTGKYILDLQLHVRINTGAEDASKEPELAMAHMEATFRFKEPLPLMDIPGYFYANALAIVYPYLRAFMSTLSQQANIKTILLPVMNLTGMEKELRSKSSERGAM